MPKSTHRAEGAARAPSSLRGGWTIPKASLVCELDVHRSVSPACTLYHPNRRAVEPHSGVARMAPRGEVRLGREMSDPGQFNPKPLPNPKFFASSLPRDKGGFLSRRPEGADMMLRHKGIGEHHTKGGVIARSNRFSPIPGTSASPYPFDKTFEFSVNDLPPPQHCRGAVISKTPQPRGGGTKLRPTLGDPVISSAFSKCSIPDVSFAAARFATRSILVDGDDYGSVDDPKLREDMAFLRGVREDIARWKLKSALH